MLIGVVPVRVPPLGVLPPCATLLRDFVEDNAPPRLRVRCRAEVAESQLLLECWLFPVWMLGSDNDWLRCGSVDDTSCVLPLAAPLVWRCAGVVALWGACPLLRDRLDMVQQSDQ